MPAALGSSSPATAGGRPRVLRPLRAYFRQVAGLLLVGSLAGIVMNTAVVLPSVLLGHAVDTVAAFRNGTADSSALGTACLLFLAGTLATELPRVGKRYWLGVARSRIAANVRSDAFVGVLGWPGERLHTASIGGVMARIIGDVEVLRTAVGEVIVETWDTLLFSASLCVANTYRRFSLIADGGSNSCDALFCPSWVLLCISAILRSCGVCAWCWSLPTVVGKDPDAGAATSRDRASEPSGLLEQPPESPPPGLCAIRDRSAASNTR